jgi:hypothetical protein
MRRITDEQRQIEIQASSAAIGEYQCFEKKQKGCGPDADGIDSQIERLRRVVTSRFI